MSKKEKPAPIRIDRARKKALRQATPFQFAIADGIDFLNADAWDAVTASATVFLQRDYLRMLEAVAPDNLSPRYALIFDEGRPVAALYMQMVSLTPDRLRKPADAEAKVGKRKKALALLGKLSGKAGSKVGEVLNEALTSRVLVGGNLLTYGFHAAAFAPDVDADRLWHAVAEVFYRIRRAEKLSGQASFVLVKDLTASELREDAVMIGLSYRRIDTEPNMVLQVPAAWKRYDDYLGSLASKYKSAVRNQILKPIEAAGYRVERLHDVAAEAARLHALYLGVHSNASLRPITLPVSYFPALAEMAGERLRCSVVRNDEHIAGFIITLKDREECIAYHIGFDRKVAKDLPVYLRLLHAAIEESISMGCQRISFGRTALEPKARLGCVPEPLAVWVRHRQPVLNALIKNLLGNIDHDEAPERNPFKKSEQAAEA